MLKGLVEAGAVKAVSIIASGSVVHAEILTLSGDKKVITTQAGAIKTCGTIDSAAKWLKMLGLGTMKLEVGKWMPNQKGLLSMKNPLGLLLNGYVAISLAQATKPFKRVQRKIMPRMVRKSALCLVK